MAKRRIRPSVVDQHNQEVAKRKSKKEKKDSRLSSEDRLAAFNDGYKKGRDGEAKEREKYFELSRLEVVDMLNLFNHEYVSANSSVRPVIRRMEVFLLEEAGDVWKRSS